MDSLVAFSKRSRARATEDELSTAEALHTYNDVPTPAATNDWRTSSFRKSFINQHCQPDEDDPWPLAPPSSPQPDEQPSTPARCQDSAEQAPPYILKMIRNKRLTHWVNAEQPETDAKLGAGAYSAGWRFRLYRIHTDGPKIYYVCTAPKSNYAHSFDEAREMLKKRVQDKRVQETPTATTHAAATAVGA